jgi:dihydroneopterin aldolase
MLQITPAAHTPNPAPSPLEKIMHPKQQPTGQPDKVEAAQGSEPQTEAPALEKPDPLSPKFAILAQREKQLRSREAQLKATEAALKAKEAEYEQSYIPKNRLKEAAMEALKKGELSYDEFTQMMLSSPQAEVDPVIREQQAKIADLQKRIEELDGNFKNTQTEQYKQAVRQLRQDAETVLNANPEFEMINGLKQYDKVVELIEETFKEENRLLSIEEAAKEIEDYLFEEAQKVASINKVKAKFTPQTPVEEKPASQQQTTQQKPGMQTLTNAVTTSKPLSARERAILAFQGKLN